MEIWSSRKAVHRLFGGDDAVEKSYIMCEEVYITFNFRTDLNPK
jgi:hypothetical protein